MRQLREFDSSAHSAGSPVECRHPAYTPHVLKRVGGGKLIGTIRVFGGNGVAAEWDSYGRFIQRVATVGPLDQDLVMVPIDWVQGQPVYHGDVVYKGRRKVAVNVSQMGDAPPWEGATLAPVEPQIVAPPADANLKPPTAPNHEWTMRVAAQLDPSIAGYKKILTSLGGTRQRGPEWGSDWADPFGERIETRMTDAELIAAAPPVFCAPDIDPTDPAQVPRSAYDAMRQRANAAIARAVADGQVVPASHPGVPRIELPAPLEQDWRGRLDQLVTTINAVAEAAPRIRLEQAASQMQHEIVRELLVQGKLLGWIGRDKAANIARSVDINTVVDKVLAPSAGQEVQS